MSRKINPRDFVELIEKYNPFGFKKPDGEVLAFETYKKLYVYTLEQLLEMFPRGYIDMTLFLQKQMNIPFHDAEMTVRSWGNVHLESDTFVLELWKDDAVRLNNLKRVFMCLHEISGTKFDEVQFRQALMQFDLDFELKEKDKKYSERYGKEGD